MLVGIEPSFAGPDLWTFECPKCELAYKALAEDPMKSKQSGWLAQERTKAARVKLPKLLPWIPRGQLRAVRSARINFLEQQRAAWAPAANIIFDAAGANWGPNGSRVTSDIGTFETGQGRLIGEE